MKKIILPIVFIFPLFTAYLSAQPTTNKSKEYNVLYLLHLKRYAAWPWMFEKASKHSPKAVLSSDTMYFAVNGKHYYQSAGTNAAPNRISILVDVIKVSFPKGDSILVHLNTSSTIFPEYSIPNRSYDTCFTISEVKYNDFYFLAYRRLPLRGRNNQQLAWRLFDSKNTRKQLARRLKGMLEDNIVHTIVIE
jgi:hypothetical protein